MPKIILFVEHGGINKEFTLRKAREFGFRIILATTHPSSTTDEYVDPADVIVTDTFKAEKLISDVEKFLEARSIRLDAAVTFKESCVIPTAALAEHFNLNGVGLSAARKSSQNKFNMRTSLKEAGFIHQPVFKKINIFKQGSYAELEAFTKPCVIKPLFGSSSHGVKKIEQWSNIKKDLSDALLSMRPDNNKVFKNFDGSMLIEEYIEGEVISVDGIIVNHNISFIGTTQFIMGEEPYFQQIGSYTPSNQSNEVKDMCKKLTTEIITTLGFDTCGFHCEWRIKDSKPYLLEIAARTVGGGILLGYEKVTGTDLIKQLFNALLDKCYHVKINDTVLMHVLHKSVLPKIRTKSTLIKLEGCEDAANNNNTWNFIKFASEGDILFALPGTPTQLYYYALKGKNLSSLLKKSDEIESRIIYETKELI